MCNHKVHGNFHVPCYESHCKAARYMEIFMFLSATKLVARYMEISVYLAISLVARYMEISMYLARSFVARYMEISMYLATKLVARYTEISMYLATKLLARLNLKNSSCLMPKENCLLHPSDQKRTFRLTFYHVCSLPCRKLLF